MDEDAITNVNGADHNTDAGDSNGEAYNVCLHEADSFDGEGLRELGSAGEVLTRVELDLAYSSEKLLNLDILLMHVAAKESDIESFSTENDNISDDFVQNGLEFDFLSSILDSEVRELENFMDSLHLEIVAAHKKIASFEHLREASSIMEGKLNDSEESLKQSRKQIAEMRMQAAKFQRTSYAFSRQEYGSNRVSQVSENDQISCSSRKLKMQTAEQQRHILRMLEKSLARELSLERRLTDSTVKLDSVEHDIFDMDEAAEHVLERLFEAENAAEVLMGISKEIMGRLQIVQFNLNGSVLREGDMRSKFQDLMEPKENSLLEANNLKTSLKEVEDKYNLASSEASALREKVHLLEEQLKECEIQLKDAKVSTEEGQKQQYSLSSQVEEMKRTFDNLKENASKAESRADNAEAECTLLTRANSVLNDELNFLKSSDNSIEKVNLLEKQLEEVDIQLQQAKASAEASQEQQNMLYSAIKDMENLINDLKSKVAKAESRAEKAEAKCAFLSENNVELNEELSFLRSRAEFLETSLHQFDDAKIATAKEINTRTKLITDLLLQLAMERERLQKQISTLTKENNILLAKFWKTETVDSVVMGCNDDEALCKVNTVTATGSKEPQEAVTESSVASFQMNKSAKDVPLGQDEVEPLVGESNLKTVRMLGPRQVNFKYFMMAALILLISYLALYLFQVCPF